MYYVFDDEQTAIAAENYICEIAKFPRPSVNASSGQLEPEILTTRWATIEQRLDGKWVFPVIPEEIEIKYPQEVRDYFRANFTHTVEEVKSDWFESLEEA